MIRALADGILALVLAPACAACRHPLDSPTRGAICVTCWQSIRPLEAPFCSVCGDPLRSWRSEDADDRCPRCRVMRLAIARGRTIGHYEGALRAIVHALKYDGRRSLARPLSGLMRIHGRSVLSGADCAVPVPLHWRRRWMRGFNQASELAAGLGIPVVHALRRRRATPPQTDLPAEERKENVRNAFVLHRRIRLTGLCVVLVDDVSTTGTTLDACARVLIEAGVREVRTLTAARVVTGPPAAHRR